MEGDAPEADEAFVAALSANRAGRALANHLASVAACARGGGVKGAVTEAIGNEKVFMHALCAAIHGTRPFPCGLSLPLPPYIAILNLSGERVLVHAETPALFTTLCTQSSAMHASELAVQLQAFVEFPKGKRSDTCCRFVLLTYSMPWQAGTDAAFWHLSGCQITNSAQDGFGPTLSDRMISLSGASASHFKGKPALDPCDRLSCFRDGEKALDAMTLKQIEAFEKAYSATRLGDAPAARLEPQNAQLMELTQRLQNDRTKDQKEIHRLEGKLYDATDALNHLMDDQEKTLGAMVDEHAVEMEKVRAAHDEERLLAKSEHSALNAELVSAQSSLTSKAQEHAQTRKEKEKALAKVQELKRQGTAMTELNNAALAKHRAEIVRLERRLEDATAEASTLKARLDKEHAQLVMRQQTLHSATIEKIHASLASKERLLNQLSDNNERLSVEAMSLKSHDEEQAATIARLTQELAEARAPAVRSASVSTRNASTATHHCASTQTAPLEPAEPAPAAPAPAPQKGRRDMQVYQNAINTLQDLVNHSRGARPVLHNGHANGYPMPLPFPHFTPNGTFSGYCPRH